MNQKRNTYHSTIKLAFALDLQNNWLPESFIRTIPRSTYHGWKNEVKEKHIGYEYASQINDNVEHLKLLYHNNMKVERQLFFAMARLKVIIINIIGKEQFHQCVKDNYREIVKVVETTKTSFRKGIHSICSFLNIKPNVYYFWRSISQYNCSLSVKEVCVKKVPSQASIREINLMKSLLTRGRFANWAICSVWGYARRNFHTSLSLQSWYKYNQKFSIRKKIKKGFYRPKYEPLRATQPNEIWHADVTEFRTLDGVKQYIFLIVDNFSRYILNWKVSDVCNGDVRTQTLKEAIQQEFGIDNFNNRTIELIVDGGSENNNLTVEQFIKESQVSIDKKIALKDIKQSNSMIEATNKTLKYSYLFTEKIADRHQLEEYLERVIFDFCRYRPNYQHGIYTPYEIHYDKKPKFSFPSSQFVIQERCSYHKMLQCNQKCC